MKIFLRDFLITLLFGLAFVLLLEWKIGTRQIDYRYKAWYMTERADRISTLILGHSLFAESLDPHPLGDSAFNAATRGRHLCYDLGIVQRYMPHMPNLRTLLLPLHTEMPWKPLETEDEIYSYAHYMHIFPDNNYLSYSALLSGQMRLGFMEEFPVLDTVKRKKNFVDRTIDSAGYSPLFHVWNDSIRPFIPKAEKMDENRTGYTAMMLQIAQACAKQGVRLVLVMPPHSDRCIELSDPERHLIAAVHEVVHEVQQACPQVELLDYYEDSLFRSPSLYADGYHLNHTGATQLAQRIKADAGL